MRRQDVDAREIVPLTARDRADLAEAWSQCGKPPGGVMAWNDTALSSEEQARRARAWISAIYPILEKHGFDPESVELVRLAGDTRITMRARRRPEDERHPRSWSDYIADGDGSAGG